MARSKTMMIVCAKVAVPNEQICFRKTSLFVKKDFKTKLGVKCHHEAFPYMRQQYNVHLPTSVTRLGDFLHFGQPFKACCNNYFSQVATMLGNFWKGVKIIYFSSEIILGNFL